jgi:hypothetical protein
MIGTDRGRASLSGPLALVTMMMPRSFAFAAAYLALLLTHFPASTAHAVKLRRPYDTNVGLGYGFDNNYGSSGCKDYACGRTCYDGHSGSDFPLVVGSTVRAAADGQVVATYNGCANTGYVGNTCGGRCGNYVKIEHSDGQSTIYCHMKRYSLTVSTGDNVSCGQKIGESASSGSSSGPHLHLGWKSSGGVYRDVYAGSCTSSPGAWRDQNGYGDPVGTSCGCEPSTEVCDGSDNDCDGEADEDEVCEVDLLVESPMSYAPPTTTDVNGDGLQDVCARFGAGWGCYLATGNGWGERVTSNKMSDDGGWGSRHYYATIRTGDVDGDGLADVCGRHSRNGYQCWRSTGSGFEHYADAPGYTNDDGWTDPGYYTTFRLADVNGDGKDDVCARGPDGWSCQLSTGSGFGDTVDGPDWTDDVGYNHAWYYGTIRTGDINADGKDDVCIRHSRGYRCYTSNGQGFDHFADIADLSNDGGWTDAKYWSTIRLADYDGDGKDDVCARFYGGYRCMRTTDSGFEAPEHLRSLSDDSGWGDRDNYSTFRVGDLNLDGADDFCVRANSNMTCFGKGVGGDVFRFSGPTWSDDNGWDEPRYYQTIAMTDLDNDRRRDLCARSKDGLNCVLRTDDGFEPIARLDDFTNDSGWGVIEHWSTLRLGSGECRAELCNGFDDDCDGEVDEGGVCSTGEDAGNGGNADAGSPDGGSADAGAPDTGRTDSDASGGDVAYDDAASTGGASTYAGKAACSTGTGSARPTPLLLALLLPLLLIWRRRRKAVSALLAVGLLTLVGCDKGEPTPDDSANANAQTQSSALTSAEAPAASKLLAVYGDWSLRGTLQPVPENSDAAPRYATTLLRDGKPQSWPLDDAFITNAVFMPGDKPKLAARLSNGRLVLASLAEETVSDTVSELDDGVGFVVSAAADGCCIAYMRGDMGMQSSLHVYAVDGSRSRELTVEQNGWSPAISPDGSKVAYVAPTPEGETGFYVHDFNTSQTRRLDVAEGAFPSGPQPPFWTDRGIAFAAERGAYIVDLQGDVLESAATTDGLLVDYSTGRFVDATGAEIKLSVSQ